MCKALAKDMRMFQMRIPSIASELLFEKGVLKTWGFQDSEFLFYVRTGGVPRSAAPVARNVATVISAVVYPGADWLFKPALAM